MTVTVGTMALPVPEDADLVRTYLNGTHVSGGLWTALTRASNHDHTGGANGTPISVSSIPDGSITTGKLDPSVLAPYALVDGSKPFTGQVTMQADAIVRDALYFGQQGTALAPDVTLSRTGAGALRVDTHLGVGVNPSSWWSGLSALQFGQGGVLRAHAGAANTSLVNNSVIDPTITARAVVAGASAQVNLNADGSVNVATAPSVAAGAVQTFTTRASIAPTGTLSLTPDSGATALTAGGSGGYYPLTIGQGTGTRPRITGTTGGLELTAADTFVVFGTGDGTCNVGAPSYRVATYYGVTGTISSSSAAVKEGITPLSPERAMQAVRDTEAVTFDYVPPTRGPEWYDLPDDPEQAEQVLQQRLTAAPLEAAARHQHGFIAEAADPLFLVGEGQTSPGSSIGVLLAALQNIDSRLAALEGVA